MKQLLSIPLWVFVLAKLVVKIKPRVTSGFDLAEKAVVLDGLRRLLPKPTNWLEALVIERLHRWIDSEQAACSILADAGVSAIWISNN